MGALVGIDPASDGLARAARMGVTAVSTGVEGLVALPGFDEIGIVFDATSAGAHLHNDAVLRDTARVGDRPDAGGDRPLRRARGQPRRAPRHPQRQHGDLRRPGDDPDRRGHQRRGAGALRRDRRVHRVEVGRPGHPGQHRRVHRDHVARRSSAVGGAERGKAIIVLNPAEPPLLMRDTVLAIVDAARPRGRSRPPSRRWSPRSRRTSPATGSSRRCSSGRSGPTSPERTLIPDAAPGDRLVVSVFLEVEGAAHYLPAYAGNLDIMTSAALQVAERMVETHHTYEEMAAAR